MSEYPREDFCHTCGYYASVRMGEKHQDICESCDKEYKLFLTLKDAARKRPPTEKPKDGEVVLVVLKNKFRTENSVVATWLNEKKVFDSDLMNRWIEMVEVEGWFKISHLIGEGE